MKQIPIEFCLNRFFSLRFLMYIFQNCEEGISKAFDQNPRALFLSW